MFFHLFFLWLKIVKNVRNHRSRLIDGSPSVVAILGQKLDMICSDLGCDMVLPYKAVPRPGVASQEASRERSIVRFGRSVLIMVYHTQFCNKQNLLGKSLLSLNFTFLWSLLGTSNRATWWHPFWLASMKISVTDMTDDSGQNMPKFDFTFGCKTGCCFPLWYWPANARDARGCYHDEMKVKSLWHLRALSQD